MFNLANIAVTLLPMHPTPAHPDPPISKEDLQQAMREYTKDPTFSIRRNVCFIPALNPGDNYVAEVYRAKMEAYVIMEGGVHKEFFAAVLVKKSVTIDHDVPLAIFKFESRVYNNVLIHLEESFLPKLPVIKCIRATEAVVVTEDFKDGDWTLSKRSTGWSQYECEKIMIALARFHAASIIFSKANKEKFVELSKYVQDQVYSAGNEESCRKTLGDSYEITRYMAEQYLPKANNQQTKAIQTFLQYTSDEMYNQARKATEETPDFAKVFVHGDCWANNIMLNSGEHALLVNMATVCLASPARDLIYVFASNPGKADNTKLIHVYVQELHKQLNEHQMGQDVINQFSIEFIDSEVKRLEKVALLTAMWLLLPISFITFPSITRYNATERKDKPQLVSNHINKDLYNRRLMEILVEYAK